MVWQGSKVGCVGSHVGQDGRSHVRQRREGRVAQGTKGRQALSWIVDEEASNECDVVRRYGDGG